MIKAIKSWFSGCKLWQKMLILYLSISIIPIAAIASIGYKTATNVMYGQIHIRLYESTRSIVNQVQNKLVLYETVLDRVIYQNDFLKKLTQAPASALYQKELSITCSTLYKDLRQVGTNEVKGVHILFPSQTRKLHSVNTGYSAIPEDLLIEIENSQQSLLNLYGEQQFTFMCRKVINPYSGLVIGNIIVVLDSASFFGGLDTKGFDEYAFFVLNGSGGTIYSELNLKKPYSGIVPKSLFKNESHEVRLMRHTFLFEPYELDKLNWNFYLLIPKNILLAGFIDTIILNFTVAIIFILLVTVFTMLLSISISRRLNQISKGMRLVSSGELEFNLEESYNGDEIGQLQYIFNEMVNKLKALIVDKYQSEIRQKEAQLKILQSQINPHFLYNCMDTINWWAIMNGDTKTSKFATNLSDFYRTSLNKGNSKLCMKDEFKNINAYIQLQQDLHGDSFDVKLDIDPVVYEYESINLILQPIVENAIEHGIEKEPNKRGLIHIKAWTEKRDQESVIKITVFNTGPSISADIADEVLTNPNLGYGLANVNSRIKLSYGQAYGVSIRPVKGGTLCLICLPAIRWNSDEQNS